MFKVPRVLHVSTARVNNDLSVDIRSNNGVSMLTDHNDRKDNGKLPVVALDFVARGCITFAPWLAL